MPPSQHSSHDSTPGDFRKHKLTNITTIIGHTTTPLRLPASGGAVTVNPFLEASTPKEEAKD